jgi:linoleoyl-CoA desaturase
LPLSAVKQNPVKSLPFTKQFGFRKTVVQRVEAYLKEHNLPQRDVPAMYLKSFIVLAWWLGTYLLLMLGGFSWAINTLLCVVFGLATAGVGFNIMHDAIHGGYSNSARINKLMGFTLELLGASSFVWRQKHNVWHHTYTNISGLDEDLETQGFLRMTPRDAWKPAFRFQHLYSPLVYGLTGFSFLIRDMRVFFTGRSDEHHVFPKMTTSDRVLFWLGKLCYFTVMIVLPLLVFPWWQVLAGYFIIMVAISLTLAAIFQLAHVMQPATFPEPVGEPQNGIPLHIENEWAIHEVETTVNFGPNNKLLNWYAGGLNFQIEHHLFPHICHVHYPRLAPIVKATCEEFNVAYNSFPTWHEALVEHLRALRWLGQRPAELALVPAPKPAKAKRMKARAVASGK